MVKAFLITHAHEDHVGGLPYVLPEFPGVPVYASTLARGLLGNKIKEHKLHNNPVLALDPGDELDIGAFHVIPFRVGHSIPDAMGIALRTPVGTIVHTGDFKFDHTPVDGKLSDFAILARLGAGGRHLPAVGLHPRREPGLHARPSGPSARPSARSWSRSRAGSSSRPSRATSPGSSRSSTPPATWAATCRSSAARWSRTSGSRRTSATSSTTPSKIVSKDKIKDHPDAQLVIATTGAQGEPMAGLARMANRDHRFVEIQPGDTVIVSASPIPGNEEYVSRTIDNLFKAGANVYYHTIKRAHVSGPRQPGGAQADARADQAQALHPDPRRVPDAGPARPPGHRDRASRPRTCSSSRTARRSSCSRTARRAAARPVTAGYVFVDGLSVGEVGEIVLRDRRSLANDGMFMIVVTVDKQTGSIVGRPEIVTRGFVHLNEKDPIMAEAVERVIERHRHARRPHQRDRAAQDPDQGRRLALPVRADQAPADGLPGRGGGLGRWPRASAPPAATRPARAAAAATRRRRCAKLSSRPRSCARSSGSRCSSSGAMTLIALLLPGKGTPDRAGGRDVFAPWFGADALAAAVRAPRWPAGTSNGAGRRGWGLTLLGLAIVYAGFLGHRPGPLRERRPSPAAAGSAGSSAGRARAAPDGPGRVRRPDRDGRRSG